MKRCRTVALAVLLLVATASVATWFTFFVPAGGEGLDFACKSNDEVWLR
ncbi:MAG: hypothetical protein IT198_10370 [Acidimicrobiia bacterium]|nr:hypothetical protein [Acidimicrobiia bacterium]